MFDELRLSTAEIVVLIWMLIPLILILARMSLTLDKLEVKKEEEKEEASPMPEVVPWVGGSFLR